MKKVLLFTVLFAFVLNVNAQDDGMSTNSSGTFKIGASLGLPMGDASDFSSLVLGVDAYYYFTDIDAFLELGATAGYRNFFGDEWEFGGETFKFGDAQFLPVAVAARLKLFGILSGGADIGYAFGLSDFTDGGFYIRPVVGIDIADTIELNLSYESIFDGAGPDDVNIDTPVYGNLNLGILFEF